MNGTTVGEPLVPRAELAAPSIGLHRHRVLPIQREYRSCRKPRFRHQLNINDAPTTTQGIQALMLGQDNYDLVGAGSGTPTPDGTQDLHLELTGLSTTSVVHSVEVIDNSDNEQWFYPESGSEPQIVLAQGGGATTATSSSSQQPLTSTTPSRSS